MYGYRLEGAEQPNTFTGRETTMERIVRTSCQGCHPECGVLVYVENGKITKIKGDLNHPSSRGFICIKGRVQDKFTNHPDRIKQPLKRVGERGSGKWQPISWDQTLGEIAGKLTEIKDKYGPEAIATYHGTGPRSSIASTHAFAAAIRTPNEICTDAHICFFPSVMVETLTFGNSVMMEKGPDYLNARCIMVVGGNPPVSHPPRGMDIIEAQRKNGAKLIVVDPRRTPLANRADLWLQIRPGTDVALALAMMNVIINEGLYNRDFVNKWCYGFDRLEERVQEYPPEKVAGITWISAERIREAANLYATIKPAVMHHRVAIEHNVNTSQTIRALCNLIALTGNLDIKGGNLFTATTNQLGPRAQSPDFVEKRIGSKQFPLMVGKDAPIPIVNAHLAAEAMLYGRPYALKAIYTAGANPVVNMQNTRKIRESFLKVDLHFVADFFMTPTAEVADYVLPPATWLERDEVCTEWMNCIAARQKVLEPLLDCRDDRSMVIDLVQRLPWADQTALPGNNIEEWNSSQTKSLGISYYELREKGYVTSPAEYQKYEQAGFQTSTGKVELYATVFEKYGYDPLPFFTEPPESPFSTPELMKDYPLILIAGSRCIEYTHSEGRQIEQLRRRKPEPEIEIHPNTAREMKLEGGEWVWVETPQIRDERIKLKVRLTEGIDPRVAHADYAWWFPEKPGPEHGCFESNISVILSDQPREPVCGSVPIRGTLCKIYK
ncbi:molybdopterin-dependent oxidoreductase [Chloroflexota bacterium]